MRRFLKRNLRFFHPSLKLSILTCPSRGFNDEGISLALRCFEVNISILISSEKGMPLLNSSNGWIFSNAVFLKIHIPDWESLIFMKKRIFKTHARTMLPNRC